MMTARHSVDIAASPDAVFDFMLDARHAAEWRELITRMEWLDGGPGAGAPLRLHFWSDGREQVQDGVLAEYDRPHRYVIENHNSGFLARFTNTVEAHETGARVTVTMNVTGDSLWGTLLVPLLRGKHRARLERTLQRLKIAAERKRD
jgi:uncharacterized protein YndB with AHSA1/START domain